MIPIVLFYIYHGIYSYIHVSVCNIFICDPASQNQQK